MSEKLHVMRLNDLVDTIGEGIVFNYVPDVSQRGYECFQWNQESVL